MKIYNKIIPLVGTLFLFGCSTITPRLDITIDVIAQYNASSEHNATIAIKERWWESFESHTLSNLVEEALQNSPDLLGAYEKIEQAKIALSSAGASYLPSIDLRAATGASKNYPDEENSKSSKSSSANVSMSYELDIWDRVGASVRASNSNVVMNIYDYEALKLTLISNVTLGYFSYIATKERLEVAQINLDIAQKILNVMEAKLRFGAINELDVSRQKTLFYNQQSSFISLQSQLSGYKNALAILVGKSPLGFELEHQKLETLHEVVVDAGIPSDLLYRRPDIAAQKQSIESSKAFIQVADAARYPSFSLSATGGSSSSELLSFANPTNVISAGLGIGYNIFDAGRLKNARLMEESKAEAVLQTYKKTVLNAFREVEDALSSIKYTSQNLHLVENILLESQKTFSLATIQYQNGAIDFTTFLDTQKSFFSAKEQYLVAKQTKLNSLVILYKALGGGFSNKG